jgi:hypothetical protein
MGPGHSPVPPASAPVPPPVSVAPVGESRASRRSLRVAIIAVIVLALAGGGTAAALVLSGGHGRPGAAPPPRHTPSHTPTPTPSSPSPTPSTPTATSTPASGPVSVAPTVASDPQTTQVVTLLDSYFGAINSHSYQAYFALLSPQRQQGMTPAGFSSGFSSTTDSDETLQSVSPGPDGSIVATVSFTSHQNPAASVNGSESCTNWDISLYLQQGSGVYLIGKSPSSYHAQYAACP